MNKYSAVKALISAIVIAITVLLFGHIGNQNNILNEVILVAFIFVDCLVVDKAVDVLNRK